MDTGPESDFSGELTCIVSRLLCETPFCAALPAITSRPSADLDAGLTLILIDYYSGGERLAPLLLIAITANVTAGTTSTTTSIIKPTTSRLDKLVISSLRAGRRILHRANSCSGRPPLDGASAWSFLHRKGVSERRDAKAVSRG